MKSFVFRPHFLGSFSGSSWRSVLSTIALGALVAGMCVSSVGSVYASEPSATTAVGSFSVGGGITGQIDPRTGFFSADVPLVSLPGITGPGIDVGVSYRQELATYGIDRLGFGKGWSLSGVSFVDVNGGVRVFPASGGAFEANASQPSGLDRYLTGNVIFQQKTGTLPGRSAISYTFSLSYIGGMTEFFDGNGNLLSRVGVFGDRTDFVWDENSTRLMAVVNDAGSRVDCMWSETGVTLVSSPRSDGVVVATILEFSGDVLGSITNPVGETMTFSYNGDALMDSLVSPHAATTTVSYQRVGDSVRQAVDQVIVTDTKTGAQLSVREWDPLGNGHLFSGWPTYSDEKSLWVSGDSEFRYLTQVYDGSTRVVSEFNSMSMMLSRKTIVSTSSGDMVANEQRFVYPYMVDGGVLDPQRLVPQYAQPIESTSVFSDNRDRSREVVERTVYDSMGRIIRHTDADGVVTETVYDTEAPVGEFLPVGLVMEKTVTGTDGTVSRTVNTPTPNHKAIQATETFTGMRDSDLKSATRTEMTVEEDGFVSEERVIATTDVSEGPHIIVTRYNRTVDEKTVTTTRTDAAETSAQFVTVTVTDKTTGKIIQEVDATGRVATKEYDNAGRVVRNVDHAGLQTVTEYLGNTSRVTDPQGVTRSEHVDALGRLVCVSDNVRDGVPVAGFERVIETSRYENNSSRITKTDARGLETVTITDVFGRPTEVITPHGIRRLTKYDPVDNTVTTGMVVGSGGLESATKVVTQRKDNKDRVIHETQTRADGTRVPEKATTYDGLGRVAEKTVNDVTQNTVFNPDGTPQSEVMTPGAVDLFPGAAITTEREYGTGGVPTKKTFSQANGQVREGVARVLDAAGRTVSEKDQLGRVTRYAYTSDGLVAETVNEATGVVVRNTYDPHSRARIFQETIAANGTALIQAHEYNRLSGRETAVYDPADRSHTEISYRYDIAGNVTGIVYPDGKTVTHEFDKYGQKIRSTDIAGNVTAYEYNTKGILVGVKNNDPEGRTLAEVSYEYDGYGRLEKLSRGNGVTTRYTFTSADEIASEKTAHNGSLVSEAEYGYDSHGNLTYRIDTRANDTESAEPAEKSPVQRTDYRYNAFNQLTQSTVYAGGKNTDPVRLLTRYTVGATGDVLSEEVTTYSQDETDSTSPSPTSTPSASHTTAHESLRTFEYNALGHLIAIVRDGVRYAQQFDAAGNQTVDFDGRTFSYNVYNQAVNQTDPDGTVTATTYWANGQLQDSIVSLPSSYDGSNNPPVEQVNPQNIQKTRLYWDEKTLINEIHTDQGGVQVTASYLLGGKETRHARVISNRIPDEETIGGSGDISRVNVLYYVTDRHGSVIAETNLLGKITTSYSYTDYGTPTVHVSSIMDGIQRNPFQYSGEYTTLNGTQKLGNRTYDPQQARFRTADTAELHNLYAYANANPITLVDPSGEKPIYDMPGLCLVAAFFALSFSVFLQAFGLMGLPFLTSIPTFAPKGFAISSAIFGVANEGIGGVLFAGLVQKISLSSKQTEILTWTSLVLTAATLGTAATAVALYVKDVNKILQPFRENLADASKGWGFASAEYLKARRAIIPDEKFQESVKQWAASKSKNYENYTDAELNKLAETNVMEILNSEYPQLHEEFKKVQVEKGVYVAARQGLEKKEALHKFW